MPIRDSKQARELARKSAEVRRKKAEERRVKVKTRKRSAQLARQNMSILEAMALWSEFRGASWSAWRVFLRALFGTRIHDEELTTFRTHTGGREPPTAPVSEAWVVAGRRGGKSRIAALVAVYLACFRDYSSVLSRGERGTVMVLAGDRRQARNVFGYITGLIGAVPELAELVEVSRKDSIDLKTGVTIEVHTASYRSVRGYTVLAAVCDEVAFWQVEGSSNPDKEILDALRPAMATVPGSVLLAISTPYARRGELWRAFERHYGQDSQTLVWQAPTSQMNPVVDKRIITEAYASDPLAAAAEYGAEFRRDVEAFLSAEAIAAVTLPDRRELAPIEGVRYLGFVDPSGGSQDSFTLAVAHVEDEIAVLDCVREVRPPFSPDQIAEEYANVLKRYRVREVWGDRYAGEWPRERFRVHGVEYRTAKKTKSDIYREFVAPLNAGRLQLLDHKVLRAQLEGLERRVARGGRDSVDHPPGARDDVANAAAGALVTALDKKQTAIEGPTLGVVLRPLEDFFDGPFEPYTLGSDGQAK
jgi:hypothetical protein